MEYKEKPTRKSFVDLEGKKFEMLEILGYMGTDGSSHLWHVKCDCGNTKVMKGEGIRRGLTKSCGCLRKNNGGNTPITQEQAESLCPHIKFIEYKGMKQPAIYVCIYCNKQGETHLANNLRNYKCDCQDSYSDIKGQRYLKRRGLH